MICHIVPRVYLKPWVTINDPEKIFVFNKYDLHRFEENPIDIAEMKNTEFAQIDFYILNAFKENNFSLYFDCLADEFLQILNSIGCEYEFYFEGKKIIGTINDKEIRNICNWEFIKNKRKVDFTEFKDNFLDEWNKEFAKLIENHFSKSYERKWGNVLDCFNKEIENNETKKIFYPFDNINQVIEFMAIQFSRRIENSYEAIEIVLNFMKEITKEVFSEEEFNNHFNEEYKKCSTLIQIIRYIKFKGNHKKYGLYSGNTVSKIIETLTNGQIFIICAQGNKKFITSDNPSFKIRDDVNKYMNMFLLPLSPQYCFVIAGKKFTKIVVESKEYNNGYLCLNANDKIVGNINHYIRNYAINQIAYGEKDISGFIDKDIDYNEWSLMLKTIGLEYVN